MSQKSGLIDRLQDVSGRNVSRETFDRLNLYVAVLLQEAGRQNLIAPSTIDDVWDRHIIDSAQLVRLAPESGSWVDIGSGAGLPGLVTALITGQHTTLVEPRRLRYEFLQQTVDKLGLAGRVGVQSSKVEAAVGGFDVLTARAVAALDRFLGLASHLSKPDTVWILPKGRNAQSELAQAQVNWHCDVRVVRSRTDPDSEILVLTRVGAKTKR